MGFLQTLSILFFLPFAYLPADNQGIVLVEVTNIDHFNGSIRIGLYDKEKNFPRDGGDISGRVIPVEGRKQLLVELPWLPYGKYALAAFHDLNDNGKLDTNILGIPSEPYAFSNNPRAKWRAPRFEEASFELGEDKKVLLLELRRWKER